MVAVWGGLRDVTDRRFDPDTPWRAPGDPVLDDFLRSDVGELVDRLAASGTKVVLLATPHVRNTQPPTPGPAPVVSPDPVKAALAGTERARVTEGVPAAGWAENDDARIDAWNALLGSVAMSRGIPYLDVAARMRTWPGGEFDPERRPDGVGISPVGGGGPGVVVGAPAALGPTTVGRRPGRGGGGRRARCRTPRRWNPAARCPPAGPRCWWWATRWPTATASA